MRVRAVQVLLLAGTTCGAVPAASQERTGPVERGLELERRGNYPAAADAFRQAIRTAPGDLNALLGLERVLYELGRAGEAGPPASAAIALDPENPILFGIAVRAWAAAGATDSVLGLVARWSALEPDSDAPYREWGFAALGRRDRAAARDAYLTGRERLRRPDALAGELARLATLEQDWPLAVTEWLRAIRAVPAYRAAAVATLGQAAVEHRGPVLAELDRRAESAAAAVAALLAVRWGDPVGGQARLARALPRGDSAAVVLLNEFVEELRQRPGRDAALARARTLEALAGRASGQTGRFLGDAARAYAEAGDQLSARRMLARLAAERSTAPDVAVTAGSTLVGVLIAEGRLDEATRRLDSLRAVIGVEEADRLGQQLVRGFLRAGQLDRAEAILAADSSVEGLALRGRARLLRGDLAAAAKLLASAGPYALDRGDATERVVLLALLQVIDEDSLPPLGAAFLALERGDSTAAARGFETVARRLPAERGGAEVLLLAGRIRAALGAADAERLLQAAAAVKTSAASPAAQLELARLLLRQGRRGEALATLESLILEYPASAVAPQARRLLDTIRGGVPGA